MAVYLLDGEVLTNSGSVATSEDCCCGGETCPCIYTLLFGPCCDPDEFSCSDTLTIDDGCGATSGCSGGGVDFFTTRFQGFTVVNTGCNDYSGSCTIVYHVNEDCDLVEVSCSGNILDGMGNCVEGCDPGCGSPCLGSGTIPNTYQVTTYNDPCTFGTGACLIGMDCFQYTPIECDYYGGVFLGEGSPCP